MKNNREMEGPKYKNQGKGMWHVGKRRKLPPF